MCSVTSSCTKINNVKWKIKQQKRRKISCKKLGPDFYCDSVWPWSGGAIWCPASGRGRSTGLAVKRVNWAKIRIKNELSLQFAGIQHSSALVIFLHLNGFVWKSRPNPIKYFSIKLYSMQEFDQPQIFKKVTWLMWLVKFLHIVMFYAEFCL